MANEKPLWAQPIRDDEPAKLARKAVVARLRETHKPSSMVDFAAEEIMAGRRDWFGEVRDAILGADAVWKALTEPPPDLHAILHGYPPDEVMDAMGSFDPNDIPGHKG
jgi:hypothetical protein